MKIKIGVIGACDTVNKVKAASDEFKSKADIYIYPYSHKDEIFKILEESEAIVDIILFSGQVPYNLARKNELGKKTLLLYTIYRGYPIQSILGDEGKRD